MQIDFYQVLEISRDASESMIKQSYRRLVLRYHPDLNPENPSAESKIREINLAYEILGDVGKKTKYDRTLTPPEDTAEMDKLRKEMDMRYYDKTRKSEIDRFMRDVKRRFW